VKSSDEDGDIEIIDGKFDYSNYKIVVEERNLNSDDGVSGFNEKFE
jgi:hypothetical protein